MGDDIKLEDMCEELIDIDGIKMCCRSVTCPYQNNAIIYHTDNYSYPGCTKYNGREEDS